MQPFAPSRAADHDHEDETADLRASMVRFIDAWSRELGQMKDLDIFGSKFVERYAQTHAMRPQRPLRRATLVNTFRVKRQGARNLHALDTALKGVAATYLLQSQLGTPFRRVSWISAPDARPLEIDASMLTAYKENQDGTLHMLAQKLVDATPIRRVDPLLEKLQARTVQAVLSGTAWHSAKAVGARVDPNAANLHALASRLLKEGRVFAIERSGVKEYPDYAFDPLGNPIPAMREVLGVLSGYSPFRLASWFESTNAHLGGRRPREVLNTDPQAVISAARAHVEGPVHG